MNKARLIICTILFIFISASPVFAGDFDGSRSLVAALFKVVECDANGDVHEMDPNVIGLPRFMIINFEKMLILPTNESGLETTTKIERLEHVEGKLILQGAEEGIEGVKDGLGWSIAISESTGKMVISASGDDVGFVIFGACTPK